MRGLRAPPGPFYFFNFFILFILGLRIWDAEADLKNTLNVEITTP